MQARYAVLILAVAAVTGVAACGSSAGSGAGLHAAARSAAGSRPALPPVGGAPAPTAAANGGGIAGALGVASGSTSSGATGDIVVGSPAPGVAYSVTAAYVVPHGQFLASFQTVMATAVALGGNVASSKTSPDHTGRIVSGQVTVDVPVEKLASFLNGMPAGWTASSINFATVDHSSDIVDVQARLASAQAHLQALQNLLSKAVSLGDITTLEQQIEEVETSIDTDNGQLSSLQRLVTYATATIELREMGARVLVAPPMSGPSLGGGVAAGWRNALLVLSVILEALVTALPIAFVALTGWLVWRRLRGRGGVTGVEVPS
jgi:hypothetical protein